MAVNFQTPGVYAINLQMQSGDAVGTEQVLAHVMKTGSGLEHKGRFVSSRGVELDTLVDPAEEFDDWDGQFTLSTVFLLDDAESGPCNILAAHADSFEVTLDPSASTFTVKGPGS